MLRHQKRTVCLAAVLATYILFGGIQSSAVAAQHFWHVKEVFTNASGSVQFIEMFDSNFGEGFVGAFTLTANSDGNIKTFKFPGNTSDTFATNNHSLLIATSGFGSLPGSVTPDFTFDQSAAPFSPFVGPFFNPNATNITITFSGSGDSMTFAGASLPKDGINSLTDSGAFGAPPGSPNIGAGTNSPTNFGGGTGSVNLAPEPTTLAVGVFGLAIFVLRRNRPFARQL
jgi:hypothetical protein